jgi:hypothetical protein
MSEIAPVIAARPGLGPLRAVGVFIPFSLAFGLIGVVLQSTLPLPSSYTWDFPWIILRTVIERSWLPTILLAAFLLGRARAVGAAALVSSAIGWLRATEVTRIVVRLIGALLLAYLDSWIFRAHNLLDSAALTAGAFIALAVPHSRASIVRFWGGLLVIAFGFSAVSYAFTVIKASLFVLFSPRDDVLMAIESALFRGLPHRWVAGYVEAHPAFLKFLDEVYFNFFDHMMLLSLFLIGTRLARERTEYLCALAGCYLVGGLLYFVLPGMGPRWADVPVFDFLDRFPLRSNSVASLLMANTTSVTQGVATKLKTFTYIASMPSLHMAQEFVMLWYSRHSRIAFALSLAFTCLTWLSTLALGWHYAIDGLAGAGLAALAIFAAHRWRDVLFPDELTGEDEPFAKPSAR